MNASVGEPYTLATYPLSKNFPEKNVSCEPCVSNTRGSAYVAATVQGDGIHILDTGAVHSAVSITLGPKTFFACPAVAFTNGQECTTFAAIQSSPNILTEETGRVIWTWSHNISSGAETKSRLAKVVSSLIHSIHCPLELHGGLLLVTVDGEVIVLDEELRSKFSLARNSSSASDEKLLKSFVYPRAECTFGHSSSNTEDVFIVSLFSSRSGVAVNIMIARLDEVIDLGSTSWQSSEPILDVSLSTTGALSVLSSTGVWHRLRIEVSHAGISLSKPSDAITLVGLSFLSNVVSVTNITSSHALLVGTTSPGNQEIAVLLWDLRYSVVIASQVMPFPPSLSMTSGTIHQSVALVSTPSLQALLTLSASSSSSPKGSRSVVLAVPLSVPEKSTIASVMGLPASAKMWTKRDSLGSISSPPSSSLVEQMRRAIEQSRIEAADNIFLNRPKSTELSHTVVKEILRLILPQKEGLVPYSPKVIQYLLENRLVTATMVEPSLLKALELRNDWSTSLVAIRNVRDIPESDLMALLHATVARNQPIADASNGMDVDTETTPEASFIPFLRACVSYPTSPSSLRIALRQHLRDASEVLTVFNTLCDWLEAWRDADVQLVSKIGGPNGGDAQKPAPTPGNPDSVTHNLPPFSDIISFSRSLLDASFVTLLQHPPAHRELRRFARHLEPELAAVEALEVLRAPLEPFARAQLKATQEASDVARGIKKAEPKQNDWRRRRKQAHERAEVSIGLYQIEELAL